jgi:hypothetical protein
MPCSDGNVPYESYRTPQPRKYNGLTGEQLEAVLCGLMTVLEDVSSLGPSPLAGNAIADALGRVDWKEAGVTRKQATDWWKAHKAADEARRASEEAKRRERARIETLRESGLNKLTVAERLALGIHDGAGMPWGTT